MIKLVSFRVKHCFGFQDSGRVNLEDASNLIYVLGRNSSGKTSFLTALGFLASDSAPQPDPNFRNFNSTGEAGELIAAFKADAGSLSTSAFTKQYEELALSPSKDGSVVNASAYRQQVPTLVQKIGKIYSDLLEQAERGAPLWVRRFGDGPYQFSTDEAFADVDKRRQQVEQAIKLEFPNFQVNVNGTWRPLPLTVEEVGSALYRLMPRITRFDRRFSLADSLPDQLTIEQLNRPDQNAVTRAFVSYLGTSVVKRFLEADSPTEQARLLRQMQEKADVLCHDVNRDRLRQGSTDLLGIVLHGGKEGIHITMTTSGKESLYRQMSDNTKLLFAYYLYQHTYEIEGDILLFDEPTNGFHATAQDQLLNFLQDLGQNGNLVIVSTHSEYLIDPDRLSGIRIMSTDSDGYLCVRNHYYGAFEGHTEADMLALRPITDAIGLRYGSSKLQIHDKVIVTEGITDMLYLRAFRTIFGDSSDLHVVPGNGDTKLLPVVALIISQDLGFKFVVDTKHGKDSIKSLIQSAYCVPDEFFWEVPIPSAFSHLKGSGIEDLFSKIDFRALLSHLGITSTDDFDSTSNSEYVKHLRLSSTAQSGPKRILAHHFYEHAKEFAASQFDEETRTNFRSVLGFCARDRFFRA